MCEWGVYRTWATTYNILHIERFHERTLALKQVRDRPGGTTRIIRRELEK